MTSCVICSSFWSRGSWLAFIDANRAESTHSMRNKNTFMFNRSLCEVCSQPVWGVLDFPYLQKFVILWQRQYSVSRRHPSCSPELSSLLHRHQQTIPAASQEKPVCLTLWSLQPLAGWELETTSSLLCQPTGASEQAEFTLYTPSPSTNQ